MSKIETSTKWLENTAKDNSHGYDQIHRMGPVDYDCSGANITAWMKAGVPVNKAVKKVVDGKTVTIPGATYTGNIRKAYLAHGFTDVTKKVNLSTGAGLKRGDVLLREGHHVAQYCGNGKEVEASINEKGKTTGGKPGDQTGKEFLIRPYRNYPWDHVLRYTAEDSKKEPVKKATTKKAQTNAGHGKKDIDTIAKEVIAGKWGTGDTRRAKLAAAGYNYTKVQTRVNQLLK